MASMPAAASGAVTTTVLPFRWHASPKQGQGTRLAASSLVECKGRGGGMSWSSRASWQSVGTRLGVGQSRLGDVVRAEQGEVSTTTSPPSTEFELNTGDVTEVDKDTFWPIVHSAGEKVVVLDMYTQWCGPCKLMLPKIIELAGKLDDVIFCKIDCNKYNKVLAKELGIRVVPTFKIFKYNELAGEVTGAKFQELVAAVEEARKKVKQ